MRRAVAVVALASACLLGRDVAAQGIFDFFGPDPSARRSASRRAPNVPRAEAKRDVAPKKREVGKGSQEPEKAAAQGVEAPAPPYETQLVRLSEVVGALAFLRELCGEKDGEEWRAKISALLDADAPSGPRRDKYVAAYNRGFRGYELTYRVCTQNARIATARYLDEAASISRELTYRFGSP